MSKEDASDALTLAIGRLLRIMWQPEDVPGNHAAQYDECRRVALDCADALGIDYRDNRANYARDCGKGAAGD